MTSRNDLEIISELGVGVLDYPEESGTQIGKFIRTGALVIAGPFVSASFDALEHHSILNSAMLGDLADTFWEHVSPAPDQQTEPFLSVNNIPMPFLNDAGLFKVGNKDVSDSDPARTLVIYGNSTHYGAAAEPGRRRTAHIFHEVFQNVAEVSLSSGRV